MAGVFAGAGGHLGGEEAGDEAVLVGGPDGAVAAEEGGAGGLFADEAEGAVDEAVDEPLEAYGDFHHGAVEAFGDAVDDAGGDEGFADTYVGGPAGPMGEEVLDADSEVVVGVEEAGGAGDDAVAVVVGVGGPGYVELVFVGDHGGHGEGAGAVHADFAVPVAGHEAEGGVDVGVEELDGEFVLVDDAWPVVDASTAEGIDCELEGGTGKDVEVDDVGEVVDVGGDVVVAVGGGGVEGCLKVDAFYVGESVGDDLVGAVLDPLGGGGVCGAAVGWVVFEASIFGRVVGGSDNDAVGEVGGMGGISRGNGACVCFVIGEDGVGEGGGGGVG